MPDDKLSDSDREWMEIPAEIKHAIRASWGTGMPPMASALYSRWWQLETWLRSLIYVELKAKFGDKWLEELKKPSESRQVREHDFRYMATPDAQNRLAYADSSELFVIMQDHWDLFESSLPSKNVWAGRIEELLAIRNRIGHCRRPHADDLARLEQTLRDLNGGAFRALSDFNRQLYADSNWTDAVVDGWVRMNHDVAGRLVEHADRQYETTFQLYYSSRPWAEPLTGQKTISGIPGYIWHASWIDRRFRVFDLSRFWRHIKAHQDTILMVCAADSSSIEVSFPAVSDPKTIADAIGNCFDAFVRNINHGPTLDFVQWREHYADIDPRVHVATAWSLVDDSMQRLHLPVSIFGA